MRTEEQEIRELLAGLVAIWDKKGSGRGGSPNHGHNIPGIWDSDNGVLAGKPCAECALYDKARALAYLPDSAGEAGPLRAVQRFLGDKGVYLADGTVRELIALAAPHPVGSALTDGRIEAAFNEKGADGNWIAGGCTMAGFKRAVRWAEAQLAAAPAPAVKGYHPGVSGEATSGERDL